MAKSLEKRGAARLALYGIAALAALLLALFFGLRGGGGTGADDVLRVANQRGSTKSMMIASGVLDGAPYRVVWSEFPAAQHLLEALGSGAVDLGLAGDAPFIFAYQSGSPIKAVGAHTTRKRAAGNLAILVPETSAIRALRDLAGKRVATTRGSVGHHLVLQALENEGMKPDSITITFLPPGDTKAAFDNGSVDAWATWAPYTIMAIEDGARIIVDSNVFGPSAGFEIAHMDAIEPKRELIRDFLQREARAFEWARDNPDRYAEVLARETGLPTRIAQLVVRSNTRLAVPIDAGIVAHERAISDRFRRAGLIVNDRPIEDAFDPSLTENLFTQDE